MQSTLLCLGVGVVLFLLAPSTVSFSRGANRASCQELTPGHIRAQPQYPQHSHIALRTSSSSYLPGQLITVSVRSSRDFMGFLLQARSVEGPQGRSMGMGPVLVGGSWTLTPPGTHTLCCLSDGDTLTHSDKQLKRNLSFVWRAPDAPMGDIRFYITVVQSYFVYWAGIESAVVHDGNSWSVGDHTQADGGSSEFAALEDEVTVLPALSAHRPSNEETASPAATRGPTETSSATQIYTPLETRTDAAHPVIYLNSSVTLASLGVEHLTNQAISERNSLKTSGSLQNAAKGDKIDINAISGVTEEHNSSLLSSHLPFTSSVSSAESEKVKPTTTLLPNPTVQNSSSQLSAEPFFSQKYGEMEKKKANMNFQDLNAQTTNTAIPSTFLPSNTVAPQSFLQLHTTLTQAHHLSPKHSPTQFLSDFQKPQTENSPSKSNSLPRQTSTPHPQLQTIAPMSSPPQQKPLSSFLKSLLQTIPTQTQHQTTVPQVDHSQSDIPPQAFSISSQPHSQTEAFPANTFGWKQSKPSVSTGSANPLLFASRQVGSFTPDKSKEDPRTPAKIKTTSPIYATLNTPLANFSGSTQQSALQSSSTASTHSLLTSPIVHHSSRYTSGASTASMRSSFRSTFFSHYSSSSVMNQPKTVPAFSSLPIPSPVSSPPHFLSAQLSSTSPAPSSFTSSTNPSFNSSNYSSPAPLFSSVPLSTSSLSPFTSSQYITDSTFSMPPSSTVSPIVSSSISSTTSLPSSPSTPTSAIFSLGVSSSSKSFASMSSFFHSTTPHPGPSPAPRRSHYNPLLSSSSTVPSQKLTVGQRLLIQSYVVSSNSEPNLNPPPPRTVVHPNPELHPNLNPNFKLNSGHDLKPNLPNTDTNNPNPPGTLDKYPDIVPRHSAWELGMLLGCSAGLGMVLVVGVRYMYRQTCGKQTEMTLNDREREYGRGERGLIHVQECGDLVRVRRIRENSFVLLAEYDILASPGD